MHFLSGARNLDFFRSSGVATGVVENIDSTIDMLRKVHAGRAGCRSLDLSRVLDAMLQLKNFESQRNLELNSAQASRLHFTTCPSVLTESAVVLLTYGPSASRIRSLWTSNKGE